MNQIFKQRNKKIKIKGRKTKGRSKYNTELAYVWSISVSSQPFGDV